MTTTSHEPKASEVAFWRTTDGGLTWQASGSASAPPTEIQVTIPTAIRPDGRWTAVWPDGSKVVSGQIGESAEPDIVSPNGLPDNVLSVRSVNGLIVALAVVNDCSAGKASCTSTEEVLASSDDGQTWEPLH